MKKYIKSTTKAYTGYSANDIEVVYPDYTGGGFWVFLGKLSDGNYFIAGNADWFVRIVDACPWRTKNENWAYAGWQEKHLVKDLSEREAEEFMRGVLEICIRDGSGLSSDFERYLDELNS